MSKLQVTTLGNAVHFGEKNDGLSITFHRTVRIPDDGKVYPLPPSLGQFPVHKVDDYLDKVPDSWKQTGGVFIPMYQREAMWMEFTLKNKRAPKAVKVAVGKVNAVTGDSWTNDLSKVGKKQDYVVVPQQSWLDGINSGEGRIRQFVAMPLGSGYSVEAQVTGKEEFGGLQIMVVDAKQEHRPNRVETVPEIQDLSTPPSLSISRNNASSTKPLQFSMGKPITVHYKRGSLGAGAWLSVFRINQLSTNYGKENVRWISLNQEEGQFTFQPGTLKSGQYHIRLFPSSSQYNPVVISEPFKVVRVQPVKPIIPVHPIYPPHLIVPPNMPYNPFAPMPCTVTSKQVMSPMRSMNILDGKAQVEHNDCSRTVSLKKKQSKRRVESEAKEMSLSAGGSMKQKIVEDPYGVQYWDINSNGRVFVHIVNSAMYKQITGKNAPETPITAQTYTNMGYKWFDKYEEHVKSVRASDILDKVQSVKQIDQQKYAFPQQNDQSVNIKGSQVLTQGNKNQVRDGDW